MRPNPGQGAKCAAGQLCYVSRDMWGAQTPSNKLERQKLPIQRVVIAHTAGRQCDSLTNCPAIVRYIQELHMKSLGRNDIAYNFLISSDGRIYAGRDWDYMGEHTKGFNHNSVGIAFIGTFTATVPTEEQLNACLLLLEEGVRLKKLHPQYRVYGARQLIATESPGNALYRIIRNWTHWSPKIF